MIPEQAICIYAATPRFDLTQISSGRDFTFLADVDLGFGESRLIHVVLRGVEVESEPSRASQKLGELLDESAVLVDPNGQRPSAEIYGSDAYICDVWFKRPDGPQFLSLAHSLVSVGVARIQPQH